MHHLTAHRISRAALAAVVAALASACGTKPATAPPPPATPFATAPSVSTPGAASGGTPGAGGSAAPASPVLASDAPTPSPAAGPQVVEPQVARRELKLPKYPSRDFDIGLFTGTYALENFGNHTVSGLRLGYHITEDFFAVGQYGRTETNDFGKPVLAGEFIKDRRLIYYTLGVGYNVLPGEIFLGRSSAKLSQGYLLFGAGTTKYNLQRKQTIDLGFGLRVLWNQRLAFQFEMREHRFALDLLGDRVSTRNPEITLGTSVIF